MTRRIGEVAAFEHLDPDLLFQHKATATGFLWSGLQSTRFPIRRFKLSPLVRGGQVDHFNSLYRG